MVDDEMVDEAGVKLAAAIVCPGSGRDVVGREGAGMTQQTPLGGNAALFNLEYPQSLGVFDSYADAQKAVDQLLTRTSP